MAEQRSPEWYQARLGKLTSSRIADALARTKSGWSASRENLKAELVLERLTGRPTEGYVSPAMQHGIDTEAQARDAYSFYADVEVHEVGFMCHPAIDMAGCSPDGLIGGDGLLEIKCPQPAAHMAALEGQPIPDKYVKQMMWQMSCTNRLWCDFVSFHPAFPPSMQIVIQRICIDRDMLLSMESEAIRFLTEVADKEDALRRKFKLAEAA